MEKINIAELLKDCPKGMELYSPLCGKCVFDCLNMGTIICKKQNDREITFTSEGYYMLPIFDNCECMIFPSKDQRDWSKFHRPFKDGDIIYVCDEYSDATFTYVAILKQIEKGEKIISHCFYNFEDDYFSTHDFLYDGHNTRFATEEEKAKLFDAIKANGYKWNAETKTLEKLVEPKFKVGDRIVHKKEGNPFTITEITDSCYKGGTRYAILITQQDNFELVPNKFDITTLKPYDKVLYRMHDKDTWCNSFYCFYKSNHHFVTSLTIVRQCIPYEGNEHLLGTTNKCDEFYETWEN